MSTLVKNLITTIFILSAGMSFAQPAKEKLREQLKEASFSQKFDVAQNLMLDKIYIDALYVWEILLEEDEKNANLHYKSGLCYILLNRESEALPSFEKAQFAVNKNYNPNSHLERNAPPEVMYYLAKANHINGETAKAQEQYTYFIENANDKHEKYNLAELGLKQCEVANKLMASPKNYTINNIGDVINTSFPEYSPVISIDGNVLYFTSKRLRADSSNYELKNTANGQYFEDVYMSYRNDNGSWSTPEYLGFCRPRRNDASISTSSDGQTVFVYQDVNGGDIYYSEMADTTFTSITPFPAAELNTEYFESHATISDDQNYLYFASDRPGGFGGLDIYRLKVLPNGEWSKAYNLGPTINSEFDEDSPFLGVDNKTMYFSSNGPSSMGGYDIFVSQVDDEDVWSTPINMGYPLNTVDDDIFYTTTADGRTGFYSSERLDGQGDKDIYTVFGDNDYIQNVAVLKGFIKMNDGSTIPSGIDIIVKDRANDEDGKVYRPRKRDGGYVLTLEPCHSYDLFYKLDDKTFHESELFVPCNSSYQELNHTIEMDLVSLSAERIFNTNGDQVTNNLDNGQQVNGETNNSNNQNSGNVKSGMVCNIVYKVQIGALTKELSPDLYNKFKPVSTEKTDLGYTRYFVGVYTTYKAAEAARKELLATFPDAFVVAYLNAVKISTTVARNVESGKVTCDESLYPEIKFVPDTPKSNQTKNNVSDAVSATASYEHYFGYNKDKFDYTDTEFRSFANRVKALTLTGQTVNIYVSSSASRVPTRSFKSNLELSAHRMNNGKAMLSKILKELDVDMSKVNIIEKEATVNGPTYKNDAVSNKLTYRKYQFIKFDIQK